jgi:hypothetical protein
MALTAFGQSVLFEAEQFAVSPASVTTNKCVQVGIYLTYTGPAADSFSQITTTIDYAAPAGFLAAAPMFADFAQNAGEGIRDTNGGTAGGGDLLLANVGSSQCAATGNILNNVTENSVAESVFMTGIAAAGFVTGSDSGTRITLTISDFTHDIVTLTPGTKYLFAVLEFPLAGSQGTGQVDVNFTPDADASNGNIISKTGTTIKAQLSNGYIQVFDTVDCGDGTNYATFRDYNGSTTSNTMNGDNSMTIAYYDSFLGGVGGAMNVDINFSALVNGFRVTGTDGYDSTIISTGGLTSPYTLDVDADPTTPEITLDGASATETYTITYYVLGLDGVTLVPGQTCEMDVAFRDSSCTATWVNNGIGGANSTFTVAIANPMSHVDGADHVYATVTKDMSAPTGLAMPLKITDSMPVSITTSGADTILSFTVIDQSIPDATWAGTWTTADGQSPNGNTCTCADVLGFVCPSNVAITNMTSPADIGGTVTVTFSGDDVLSFDLTYDGVTHSDVTSPYDITVVGDQLTVTVVGNGVGPAGQACSDTDSDDITFANATCGNVTLVPAPPADGYSVGDTITTIAVEITGASSVTIDGVACTASADPTTTATVTWTYPNNYTVVGPDSLPVVATNPNGTTTTCGDIVIEVDCTEANIESISPAGTVNGSITIEGISGLDYSIWYGPCGQAQFDPIVNGSYVGDIHIGADVDGDGLGEGTLANINIVEDVCYYVVCPGGIIASNSIVRTVPTLGEWGTAFFVVLVMFAGLFILRRKN